LSVEAVEQRFASQLLAGDRAADAAAVCDRLLAVQAQDLRSARLAVRARTSGLAAHDVDRALTDGTLVVGWLNRGTLQLVRREDYWWLHALTTPPLFTSNARRLEQTGVTAAAAERGVAAISRALAGGPLSRDQLRERVQAVRVPTAGQAFVHVVMLACLRGIAVRGPFVGKTQAYMLTRDWLGPPELVDRERALGELARRYLDGHAPAGERDLAKWAGLPLRDVRAGLGTIATELVQRSDELLELNGALYGGPPRVCLLDQWDPLLVGWQTRESLLEHYPRRSSPEAHYRPFAYVDARAVATWSLRQGTVTVGEPFVPLKRAARTALAAEATDVVRFLQLR
jgi:Winged helix DNA-binding domain